MGNIYLRHTSQDSIKVVDDVATVIQVSSHLDHIHQVEHTDVASSAYKDYTHY